MFSLGPVVTPTGTVATMERGLWDTGADEDLSHTGVGAGPLCTLLWAAGGGQWEE